MRVEIPRKLKIAAWRARPVLAAGLLAFASTQTGRVQTARAQSSEKEALSILQNTCFQCHGEALQMGHLDLRARASVLKGGDRGPALVPGNTEQSLMIQRVTGTVAPRMPMAPMPALSEREVGVLKE